MHQLLQFKNCYLLRDHQIIKDDLWVRDGLIQNPEKIFFEERETADIQFDCHGALIAPGFIDVQINGAMGCDFSLPSADNFDAEVRNVAKLLLSHGVTSFCPTIVTSPATVYKQLIPRFKITEGSQEGAGILGLHIEGPFINVEKKGAHPAQYILPIKEGMKDLLDTYGSLDNVSILTLAPELDHSAQVIEELVKRNIVVSLGHSIADLSQGEKAARHGASFITHLFNAMLPFHHRDPHLVGLLASDNIPAGKTMFYGIIADGIHTHAAALRIAYRTHPNGIVLVTDACPAMGLPEGKVFHMGQQKMEIRNGMALLVGTNTLAGSMAQLDKCIQCFQTATECSKTEALDAATRHPAELLNIAHKKGTLDFGTDADFVILDDQLNVHATFIAGEKVWSGEKGDQYLTVLTQ